MLHNLISLQLMSRATQLRAFSSSPGIEWLNQFINYEQKGVPQSAGTNTAEGFDMERMKDLVKALDSPQEQSSAVHVAGTKGKGSTVTMIASILKHSGYKVGTYTSPHITTLHERISINGAPIPPSAFDDLISRHKHTIESEQQKQQGRLSHFEILTALAFKHFQEENVDIAVVETGLGGVRDATNVLSDNTLKAAVVTAVGMDHAAALGGSMESIARAKAGIFKSRKPAIIAAQPHKEAYQVVHTQALDLNCDIIDVPKELRIDSSQIQQIQPTVWRQHGSLTLLNTSDSSLSALCNGPQKSIDITLRMIGSHQIENAATALCTVSKLKQQGMDEITLDTVSIGLEEAVLPGRFQLCRFRSSSSEDIFEQPIVVLDGAHTAESASALVQTFTTTFGTDTPLAIVLAMADDKPHKEFCTELRKLAPVAIVFTQVDVAGSSARAAAPGALMAAWQTSRMIPTTGSSNNPQQQQQQVPVRKKRRSRELVQASLVAATERARMELRAAANTEGSGPGVILVCGSLHAVGAALQQLDIE